MEEMFLFLYYALYDMMRMWFVAKKRKQRVELSEQKTKN